MMAGVSAMTITRFENGHTKGYPDTLSAIRFALEGKGIQFLEGGTVSTGVGVTLKTGPDDTTQFGGG
ncbi:hypothetical protein [Labrys okinawensis]|nr:hypothetical protein [Labrys okinawensis]